MSGEFCDRMSLLNLNGTSRLRVLWVPCLGPQEKLKTYRNVLFVSSLRQPLRPRGRSHLSRSSSFLSKHSDPQDDRSDTKRQSMSLTRRPRTCLWFNLRRDSYIPCRNSSKRLGRTSGSAPTRAPLTGVLLSRGAGLNSRQCRSLHVGLLGRYYVLFSLTCPVV